jgi:hypothetical protein
MRLRLPLQQCRQIFHRHSTEIVLIVGHHSHTLAHRKLAGVGLQRACFEAWLQYLQKMTGSECHSADTRGFATTPAEDCGR